MILGEKVRYIRKTNELNQKEFADRIGVSQGTLSDIERGICSPSYETIMALHKAFKCDLNWLFNNEGQAIENDLITMNVAAEEKRLLENIRALPNVEKNELIEIVKLKLRKLNP
ncbi:helix-turn-helix transcriptional regulator [Paenibacillus frigoriresistens]|uniref:helix-turn-helix domain-containing protein n=1 Tax=Paenibacillus alginolyticus TaxID=59839 RepID=UPI001566984C|nr:helix-turn-helix transcriptional regulator [Paenibacillus frigoriresistens]NRF95820.1 helix-turn-helix transcriptional regulator [Paenibacillus frigoriresistens]